MSDLIDRQAALDAIYRYADNPKDKEIYKAILALPSAEPHDCNTCRYNTLPWYEEPCDSCTGGGKSNHWKPMSIESNRKMGKWVKAERDGVIVYSDAYAQCSMCKEVTFLGRKMKYCPNCGAKMEVQNER